MIHFQVSLLSFNFKWNTWPKWHEIVLRPKAMIVSWSVLERLFYHTGDKIQGKESLYGSSLQKFCYLEGRSCPALEIAMPQSCTYLLCIYLDFLCAVSGPEPEAQTLRNIIGQEHSTVRSCKAASSLCVWHGCFKETWDALMTGRHAEKGLSFKTSSFLIPLSRN